METGATGLEPATSAVTGRFKGRDDWRRLTRNRSIHAGLRAVFAARFPMVERSRFRTFAARLLPWHEPAGAQPPAREPGGCRFYGVSPSIQRTVASTMVSLPCATSSGRSHTGSPTTNSSWVRYARPAAPSPCSCPVDPAHVPFAADPDTPATRRGRLGPGRLKARHQDLLGRLLSGRTPARRSLPGRSTAMNTLLGEVG
jgi:hypothetical protein